MVRAAAVGFLAEHTVAARLWGSARVGGPVLFGRPVTARLPAKGGLWGSVGVSLLKTPIRNSLNFLRFGGLGGLGGLFRLLFYSYACARACRVWNKTPKTPKTRQTRGFPEIQLWGSFHQRPP